MDLSNFFRFAYWLDPATNALPPSPRLWLAVVAGLVWAVCGLIGPLSNATPRTVRLTLSAVANILAGLLFSAVSVGRILALPILGWRIGWLVAGVIALLPAGWRWLQLAKAQRLLAHALQTLAFAPLHQSTIALPWPLLAPWLIGHMLGMAITTSIHRWPLWVGWLLIGFMLLPVAILISPDGLRTANRQFRTYMQGIWDASILSGANSDSRSRRTGSPSKSQFWHTSPRLTVATLSLAPLVLVYATVALRVLTGLINYLSAGEYRVPEPYSTIFNPTLALLVAVGYGFVLSARAALAYDRTLIKVGAAAMVVLSLGWSIWMALRLRTHGVSGSDPYAYTQMGVDLVTRGTLFHPFPLVRLTYALEIPSEPVMHIGYKLPIDVTRTAPTVWPPGYAIFTGLAYLIGGETGVFVLAPILSLFSLLIVAWLTREIMRSESPRPTLHAPRFTLRALPTVALTVLLTATSYQQIEWQLIPMADIAAQLFSLLALTLSLRYSASNQPPTTNNQRSIALAGLCIGIAFGIRYTQVLIAPAIALALWLRGSQQPPLSTIQRLRPILIAGLFAALAALPTLAYHAAAFGSPFRTGSDELQHFSLTLLPQTIQRLAGELLWYREFGLLLPLMLIGVIHLWRNRRSNLAILLTYALTLLGFHLLYSYVRQRDLLSIFPVFYLFAAVGSVSLWQAIETAPWRDQPKRWLSASVTLLLCFLIIQRSIETLMLPITRGFGAFGYLVREQRQAFGKLAELTPENAVIACSLNSGAVDLHAHRLSFRPASWTAEQLVKFVGALRDENTPVYLLDDGKELIASIDTLRTRFGLVEVGQIDVPYYFPNSGGSENRRVPLYQVQTKLSLLP